VWVLPLVGSAVSEDDAVNALKVEAGGMPRGGREAQGHMNHYPIRPGHRNALKAMAEPEFRRIIELFERAPEIGGTYFRIVEGGIQPVDLDPSSRKPLMGVGR
jgi:hypothetical protein